MVVVVVVGILVSIFTLSVGGFAEDTGAEDVRRLEALLDLARDEATMQGRELGVTFYQHGYEFALQESFINKDGVRELRWAPLTNDRLLRRRNLGDELSIDLELDGEEITLLYEPADDKKYEPHVFLLSSGDLEPEFTVRLRPTFENEGYLLSATADGTLEVSFDGADDAG